MKLEEIHGIAESRGVHPSKLSKTQLLKSIQTEDGVLIALPPLKAAIKPAAHVREPFLMQR